MKIFRKALTDGAPFVALTITRDVPVTIERAFDAWISSRLLARWLVPPGSHVSSVIVDPCEGGDYRIEGFLAEGAAFAISGTYLVVEEPTKLAMSWFFDGPAGALQDEASIITVDFAVRRPKLTAVTVTHEQANMPSVVKPSQPRADGRVTVESRTMIVVDREANIDRLTPDDPV